MDSKDDNNKHKYAADAAEEEAEEVLPNKQKMICDDNSNDDNDNDDDSSSTDRCSRCNASQYKWNDNSEEVEDDSNKKCKERWGWKRKNVTPDHDIEDSKERKVSTLVMWYLPMIDHLKCMF
jgi:hypothetical protein